MSALDSPPQLDPFTPPLDGMPEPPPEPTPDSKPNTRKRPTTRAERAAVAQANRAKKPKADSAPKGKPTPRRASLETRLQGSLATIGTAVMVSGSMTSEAITKDGLLIVQNAPNIAAALDKVAKDDPRVAAALERMLTVGTWSGLIAAVLPVAVGIAANHGAIPGHVAALFGTEAAPAEPEPGGGIV